jgi:hypothetical protein
MKVFAIITAGLMAAGAGAYYLHSDSAGCPLAKSGGCCVTSPQDKPGCCETACPACTTDCTECCDVCELCCTAGVQASVAAAKADCCVPGADCCFGAGTAVAKPAATEDCCSVRTSPTSVATAAAVAGIGGK